MTPGTTEGKLYTGSLNITIYTSGASGVKCKQI
jgi:hypothetical protein